MEPPHASLEAPSADCPFCERLVQGATLLESELAFAIPDGYPVSPGHTLVVPKRHEGDYFSLTAREQRSLWDLAGEVCSRIGSVNRPNGFNLGLNAGAAAGQTVPHVHVHVIPRYEGDSVDPRGGVRWVIPEKAAYWRGETSEG